MNIKIDTTVMNIEAIRVIISRLHNIKVLENMEVVFRVSFDDIGGLVVVFESREAEVLIKNLAGELGLDYISDFWIGCTRIENLPEALKGREGAINVFRDALEEYLDIAGTFTR